MHFIRHVLALTLVNLFNKDGNSGGLKMLSPREICSSCIQEKAASLFKEYLIPTDHHCRSPDEYMDLHLNQST